MKTTQYKVITEGRPNEVWARGFYGDEGKHKAQTRINEGYFHRYMYDADKGKKLIVIEII